MDNLQKLKHFVFKEGIPKHITSGTSIHHPLGTAAGTHWGIGIVVNRDEPSSVPFKLTEHLLNVITRVRLHCLGLEGKVFAVGTVKFTISVFPSFEVTVCRKQFHHLFEGGHSVEVTNDCTVKKIDPSMIEYLRSSKNHLYIGGEVILYSVNAEIKAEDSDIDALHHVRSFRHEILSELSQDLKYVLRDHTFADLKLLCGSEIFQAHKVILSGRSPVFLAMFSNPMKESLENEVVIEDMEPRTFRTMLEYIYSGQIDEMTNLEACELMSAADRYQLPGLKKICVDQLESGVSVENVLRILVYADLYDDDLKRNAFEVICNHYDYLKSTIEWKNLQSEKSALIMEVMDYKIQSLSKK